MIEIYRDVENKVYRFQKSYTLDNEAFNISLEWNPISSSWFMNIKTTEDVLILPSTRLVSSIFMLANKRSISGLPKGDFKLIQTRTSANDLILDYDNFGAEFKLYYYLESEV